MLNSNITPEKFVFLLKKVELFRHVPSDVIEKVAGKMIVTTYKADELIVEKGEEGNSMYLIAEGRVRIHDGSHVVAEMSSGDFFGEMSLLDSEPRSMSVSAIFPTTAGLIHRSDFYQVLREFPETMQDIVTVLIGRLRNQNSTLVSQFRSREMELEKLVKEKTHDLQEKNSELTQLLSELKRTQQQLISQEKLASLGQLTAGIAHEIQNPLNFVNNFSELSLELLRELDKIHDPDERTEILKALQSNLEKVHFHGKRADTIVRNMMLHSRSGPGERTAGNLNKLASEYLQLAFHGMRIKDPGFQCELITEFDTKLPAISMVPQDMSRVILNILNNAFYVVGKKQNSGTTGYTPTVTIRTRNLGEQVELTIADNGGGVPQEVREKIFQPFFTTKPTGEGTGLGLSLSYDIVKGHGGDLLLQNESGTGATFIIRLPY